MNAFQEEEYQKRIDINLWKRLFKYTGPYRREMSFMAVSLIGLGAVDAIYPLLMRYAVDHFILPGNTRGLGAFAAIYAVLAVIQTLNVFGFINFAGKIENGICYDVRKEGFHRLQELSLSYYDKTPVGWILARLTSDTTRLGETIAWGMVDILWGFAVMFIIAGTMAVLNLRLAAVVLSVVPVLAIISVYFQKRILELYRFVRKTNSRITGAFSEGILGARTTKTLGREEKNLEDYKILTGNMFSSSVKVAVISSVYLPIVMTLGSVGTGLALWLGGKGVTEGTISYGTLVAFISYTVQFFEPVRELARVFAEFQSAQASAERVMSLINTPPEISDSEAVAQQYGDFFIPKKENWPAIEGRVSFKEVYFSYKDGEEVLVNFNLDVKPGETIALVGDTGSGKSTIVNLACRFYEPQSGQVLIDGADYRERSQLWLQSHLGYVLQSPHLFSGTIKDNIRYGRLEASEDEVIRAATLVNAHDFIMRLEDGYETQVGEGGGRLSTGEKQLISFARALLADPRILVLDEATSSIDTETEQKIQLAIREVLKGRTSFIVAHRLSTIRTAHRILVIDKGKILEEGNHRELMKRKGYYYELYTNQFREEQERQILA